MEVKNYKVINNFITQSERNAIIDWVSDLRQNKSEPNHHLNSIKNNLNGESYMFDISNTVLSGYITKYQAINEVNSNTLPETILDLKDRISEKLQINHNDCFLQVLNMQTGGRIPPHYDATVDGYVNFKCNISVMGDEYKIYLDSDSLTIKQCDMYCFEASLYKHWTEEFSNQRILLSFGFILPYNELGWSEDDPRIRLSKRITKYFQNLER